MKDLFSNFAPSNIILGDNPGLKPGRGKPAPDIFLLALAAINRSLRVREEEIIAEQCIVFEDSVAGVQAAKRAGMRVVWVPNTLLAAVCEGKEGETLAGRSHWVGLDQNVGEVGTEEQISFLPWRSFRTRNMVLM
jgi:pseudouridine-5'-monophosphatase